MDELNNHTGWRQGEFIDQRQYARWSQEQKDEARAREKYLVRPGPTDNAICTATSPDLAAWIAERLNLAATLESQLAASREEVGRLKENLDVHIDILKQTQREADALREGVGRLNREINTVYDRLQSAHEERDAIRARLKVVEETARELIACGKKPITSPDFRRAWEKLEVTLSPESPADEPTCRWVERTRSIRRITYVTGCKKLYEWDEEDEKPMICDCGKKIEEVGG